MMEVEIHPQKSTLERVRTIRGYMVGEKIPFSAEYLYSGMSLSGVMFHYYEVVEIKEWKV